MHYIENLWSLDKGIPVPSALKDIFDKEVTR